METKNIEIALTGTIHQLYPQVIALSYLFTQSNFSTSDFKKSVCRFKRTVVCLKIAIDKLSYTPQKNIEEAIKLLKDIESLLAMWSTFYND